MQSANMLSTAEVDLIMNAPAPEKAQLQLYKIDNDTAKKIAMTIAGKIPQVGGVLSVLMDLFWPTDQVSIWDQIKDQVEALVDQKIAENNLANLRRDLKGVQINLKNYEMLTDIDQKKSTLQSINTTIVAMIPTFLSGDVSSGFSCFWGIALLHLSVRKELWELYQDQANIDLLRTSTILYCKFGRVALSNIYNGKLDQVGINAESTNQPGKASNWIINVNVVDDGKQVFEYSKYFGKGQWNPTLLDQCTVECNNGIMEQWGIITSRLQGDLASWAYDAIVELEAEYSFTEKEAVSLIADSMTDDDYKIFSSTYYPSASIYNNPQVAGSVKKTRDPHVKLNPF